MGKKAVIFGAGNIGRGFIGQLFCESGYEVTFIDVDATLITALNRDGQYRLQTVFNEDVHEYLIGPVRALHADDAETVADAVADADIGATAVGAGALTHVTPNLAAGIARRIERGAAPLNIILCENLKGAAGIVREAVEKSLPSSLRSQLDRHAGFVDTVIGRMVPIPTPEMRERDVSLVRVEPYKELPVDRAGFAGPIPDIVAMEAHDNFAVFTARKLYIHNCGHAFLAYCGYLRGHVYGYEALDDPLIHEILQGGLDESMTGIVHHYAVEKQWLQEHAQDLLRRFANRALGDSIFRLGRDPLRKLKEGDRLSGAAALAVAAGIIPQHLACGIAAGLCFDHPDDASALRLQQQLRADGIERVLPDLTGFAAESAMGKAILAAYARLRKSPGNLGCG